MNFINNDQIFRLITDFEKPKEVLLTKRNVFSDKAEAIFEQAGKKISLTFVNSHLSDLKKHLDVGQNYKRVEIEIDDTTYQCKDFYINKKFHPSYTAIVDFIYTKGFSFAKSYYFRLVIPLKKRLLFHYLIDTDETFIDQELFNFRVIENDRKENFLVLESKIKQSYHLFSEKAHSIKNAIGYITGHLAGDYGYFMAYSRDRMETIQHVYRCQFRDSIISSYSPIYSNPFGYIRKKRLADKYYKNEILRPLNKTELSTLCQKLYDSVEFTSTIVLILESSIASLLFMPGGYAIVLERLADIIKSNEKQKIAPLTKADSKQLRKEFNEIAEKCWSNIFDEFSEIIENHKNKISSECLLRLNNYKDLIVKDNLITLKKRINGINKATNKAQLKRPFDFLKIELLDKDLELLGTRDDLLHGRIPDISKAGKHRSLERQNKDLYYTSMRFYTLINMLILKWIGYDNRVVNYPKINETFTDIKLKEDPYRLV